MAEPSAEVIRRAQCGDEAALSELVSSQQNYIYSIAMGIFRNPDDAAEMTQEAFIRLFRVLPTFRGDTRFTTWLYRLVVNLCYDELRYRRRRPLPAEDGEEALSLVSETASWGDPEGEALQSDTQACVQAALQRLEEPYRLCLVLYYFQGLKYREIADITGWPLNTVKSHIRRGKIEMAELLTDPNLPMAASVAERRPAAAASLARMAG
jgi:RNA polymerase sigma-70 factor (ECF subfamily)